MVTWSQTLLDLTPFSRGARFCFCKQLEQSCTLKSHKAEVRDKGPSSKKTLYVQAWLKGTEWGGGTVNQSDGEKGPSSAPLFHPSSSPATGPFVSACWASATKRGFSSLLFPPPCSFLFIRFHAMPAKTAPSSCPKWLWTLLQWDIFSQRVMKGPFWWCWLCFDRSIQ